MKKKIFLVDDDKEITGMTEIALRTNGYNCLVANESSEVVARAEKEKPDLIILDIMMPGIDGTDLNIALKVNSATKNIPVIFLTGIIKKSEEEKSPDQQNIVLAKPFSIYELLSMIKSLLGG